MALGMARTIHLHDAEKNLVTTLTIEEHLASDNLLDEENPENEILTILSQVHDDNPPLRAPIMNIERNHPAAQALILLIETINKNGFLTFVLNPEQNEHNEIEIEVESHEGRLMAKISQDESYNIHIDVLSSDMKETLEYALKKAVVFVSTQVMTNTLPRTTHLREFPQEEYAPLPQDQTKEAFYAFFREKPAKRKEN